jgi:cytochrome c oxidase cbb3-type subunit 3
MPHRDRLLFFSRGPALHHFRTRAVIAVLSIQVLLGICLAQQTSAPPANPSKSDSPQPAPGRPIFESHCASCHGLDGRGGEHAHAIATPRVAGEMEDPAIFQIIRGGIPPLGMPTFSTLSEAEIRAIVSYIRVLTGQNTVRPAKGNSARGAQIFFGKARCGDCHTILGKGGFMGSDLTDFARSHSAEELHRAIINPDQWIPPVENMVTVTTLSQERITGLLRNEDNFSLQLQDADGIFHLFMKSQIAKIDRESHSLMPQDYGTRLTPAELDDLINYMFSGLPAPARRAPKAGN